MRNLKHTFSNGDSISIPVVSTVVDAKYFSQNDWDFWLNLSGEDMVEFFNGLPNSTDADIVKGMIVNELEFRIQDEVWGEDEPEWSDALSEIKEGSN